MIPKKPQLGERVTRCKLAHDLVDGLHRLEEKRVVGLELFGVDDASTKLRDPDVVLIPVMLADVSGEALAKAALELFARAGRQRDSHGWRGEGASDV